MCGIFYYQTFQCGKNGISTSKAKRLFADFAKIQHRGPDNSQFQNYVASTSSGPMSYIFGFHRLAFVMNFSIVTLFNEKSRTLRTSPLGFEVRKKVNCSELGNSGSANSITGKIIKNDQKLKNLTMPTKKGCETERKLN